MPLNASNEICFFCIFSLFPKKAQKRSCMSKLFMLLKNFFVNAFDFNLTTFDVHIKNLSVLNKFCFLNFFLAS